MNRLLNTPNSWPDAIPLDVYDLTRAILEMVRRAVMADLDSASREYAIEMHLGSNGEMAKVGKTVADLVIYYDACRTEQLRVLRAELIRLHSVTITPIVINRGKP